MTTSDERRAAGRADEGQLWPATRSGATGQSPPPSRARELRPCLQSVPATWARPGLAVRDRSTTTVALLAARASPRSWRSHIAGALNVGITCDEIVEILTHVSIYAGVPAAAPPCGGGRRAGTERAWDCPERNTTSRLVLGERDELARAAAPETLCDACSRGRPVWRRPPGGDVEALPVDDEAGVLAASSSVKTGRPVRPSWSRPDGRCRSSTCRRAQHLDRIAAPRRPPWRRARGPRG